MGSAKLYPGSPGGGIVFVSTADGLGFLGQYNLDSTGTFQQWTATEPGHSNNWGVGLTRAGTSGPGTAAFRYDFGPLSSVVASFSSSHLTKVTLSQTKAYAQEPCNPCMLAEAEQQKREWMANNGAGKPVSVTTGEMYFSQTDGVSGDLVFTRSYSSNAVAAGRYGMFGPGWNTTLDQRLRYPETRVIEARLPNGAPVYYYDANSDGFFEASLPESVESWIETQGSEYKRVLRRGGFEIYDVSSGRIKSTQDASGVTTTYTRDALNRITGVSRLGRTLTFSYAPGNTHPAQLLSGSTVLATYAFEGTEVGSLLMEVTYPDGSGYRYAANGVGRLFSVSDRSGRVIEAHEYDSNGRATTSETFNGRDKLTFTFETRKTTLTDALGNQTIYEWEYIRGIKYITKITGPCQTCGGGGGETQEWTYDDRGNVLTKKDAFGKVWTMTYSANDELLTVTDPLNQATTYTYDAQGRTLTRTGPDGAATTYVHSPSGPTSITQSVTASTTRTTAITYHATTARPETITDPRGKVTTMAYDGTTGDLLTVTDPLGHATTFTYDAQGRRTKVKDALDHETTTTYDANGRVTRVTNHDGTHSDFVYDKGGRRSEVIDPLGRKTRYAYDLYGRLISVVDPMNQTTGYAYDLMGNLLTLTDAKDQTTAFEYDGHNRVKKTIYPGGAYETFNYDGGGRLSTIIDRKGTTTTYVYDNLSRLTGKTFSDGTPAFSYTYDVAGRMLTAANGTDTLTWTYNLAGELLSEQSAKNASTVAYQYDNGGNRIEVKLDGTVFVTYAYDDASRLTSITRGSNVFGFTYDNANRRTGMSYPNGVDTSYTYDNLNRLTNLAATKTSTGTPITNFGYQYDAAGNRTQKSTLDYTEDYGYDPLYRLTRADRTNPGATPPNQWTWNYDAVGNRTSAQKDQEATTSTHNEKNQLLQTSGGGKMLWRGTLDEPGIASFSGATINGQPARMLAGNVFEATLDLPAGANTVTIQAQDGSGNTASKSYSVNVIGVPVAYTYDANGNLATKTEGGDTWVYTWNALNELAAVTKNGITQASYQYDPLGRRVEKVAGTTTTRWTYDAEDIQSQSTTIASVASTASFVHGPDLDEPIGRTDDVGALVAFIHVDGIWSVVKETNTAGTVSETLGYDPWGVPIGATRSGYGFTSREWDSDVGLYYYRARYYDPAMGRFGSTDPLGARLVPHLYSYVDSNPINATDPTGLLKTVCTDCGKAGDRVVNATATFCKNATTMPSCQMMMRHMMPKGVITCVERTCRDSVPILCRSRCPIVSDSTFGPPVGGPCGTEADPLKNVVVERPHARRASDAELADTIGHEILHYCGHGADAQKDKASRQRREAAEAVALACKRP